MPTLDEFDYILSTETSEGVEEHGYLVQYAAGVQEIPWALLLKEQEPPKNTIGDTEDEHYGFRDLSDSWRISFSNFAGGTGQLRRDVVDGAASRYADARAVDTSVPGEVKLQRTLEFTSHPRLAGKLIEFDGVVCAAFDPQVSSPYQQVGFLENGSWTYADIPSPEAVKGMATDGEYVYVAMHGGGTDYGIFRGGRSGTWERWAEVNTVSEMVYSGGYLYCVRGGAIGFITLAGQWNELGIDAVLKPNLDTFGLAAIGNWVYWGVTSGARSWIYAVQWDGQQKNFELYVETPTGFVGTSLAGYIGNLYICGYYLSLEAGLGQGVVYLATSNGIALLCRIGEDPAFAASPNDEYANRITSCVGYDHRLWILTNRALYQWNIRDGGLMHVAEVGAFAEQESSAPFVIPYVSEWPLPMEKGEWSLIAATGAWLTKFKNGWRPAESWPYYAYTATGKELRASLVEGDLRVRSISNNVAGEQASVRFQKDSFFPVDGAGTLRVVTQRLDFQCLQFGVGTRNYTFLVALHGRDDDKVAVRTYGNDGWTLGEYIEGKDAEHVFHLTGDQASGIGRLYIDDTLYATFEGQYASESVSYGFFGYRTTSRLYFGYGWGWVVGTNRNDWSATVSDVWAADGSYEPDYARGTVAASSFLVLGSRAYVPTIIDGVAGLVGTDTTSYVLEGWLETSSSASGMPTVEKQFTYLDVSHEPLTEGQQIRVYTRIDNHLGTSLVISPDENRQLTSVGLTDVVGRRAAVRVELTGPGGTTPVFHGASLRFAPPELVQYHFLTDLREETLDRTQKKGARADAREFLLAAAARSAIVTLKLPSGEERVKIIGVQFRSIGLGQESNVCPQGVALVQLKRV